MSRIYSEAATALAPCLDTSQRARSSLKSRILTSSNAKLTHLLVNETLKRVSRFDLTLQACRMDLGAITDNRALAYVLLYELLVGRNKKIKGGGGLKRALVEREGELREAWVRFDGELEQVLLPRYCRVNSLRTKDVGRVAVELGGAVVDEHVRCVVRLPPGTDVHDHELVKNGTVILQDKSSCFPAQALGDELRRRGLDGFDAIDACAAPGNKTSQLAGELSGPNAKVFAFDKSGPRFNLMEQRLGQAGALPKRAEAIHGDFLAVLENDPKFARVRSILLDPSCSGSGVVSIDRQFESSTSKVDEARVDRLVEFQIQALTHALSFPQVQVVSYSTCSVYAKENENVVEHVLKKFGHEWKLTKAIPTWPRRGYPTQGLDGEQADAVLRADASLGDETGGFFVALFARIETKSVKTLESKNTQLRAFPKLRFVSLETVQCYRELKKLKSF